METEQVRKWLNVNLEEKKNTHKKTHENVKPKYIAMVSNAKHIQGATFANSSVIYKMR